MAEIKDKAMRDIRGDLEDRAGHIRQQIEAEQAKFESLIERLKAEQNTRLEDLRPQLQSVSALLQFETFHHDVCMALTRAIALAATAEIAARRFAKEQNDPERKLA